MKLSERVELKGHEFDDPARVVVNNLQSNNPISRLSAVTKKRDRQQQQQHRVLPLEHLNILPGTYKQSISDSYLIVDKVIQVTARTTKVLTAETKVQIKTVSNDD